MLWLDPALPAIRSAVVSGGYGRAPHSDHAYPTPIPDAVDTIVDALEVASETLERYTGFAIHPAGTAVEEFVATPQATRLSPTFTPLRSIVSIASTIPLTPVGGGTPWGSGLGIVPDPAFPGLYDITDVGTSTTLVDSTAWSVVGNDVLFGQPRYLWPTLGWWWRRSCSSQQWANMHIALEYEFGSTISAGARRSVIALAHNIWLESSACEGCTLPFNTTMEVREGLTLTMDPTQLQGRTGIPVVDSWLNAVNPHHALRRSGVYTPSSPPPVTRSIRTARPTWPAHGADVHLSGGANLSVGATP
jgi:hypothetical protein